MAFLTEATEWPAGISQIELMERLRGGPGGELNRAAAQLANRTTWLKERGVFAALRAQGIHYVTDPLYGGVGDGITDDAAAWRAAATAAAGGVLRVPRTEGGHRIGSTIELPDDVHIVIDKGAVIKPVLGGGVAQLFTKTAAAPTVTTALMIGYTLGSRAVVVVSASGLAPEQEVTFTTDAPGGAPPSWNRIKTISGSEVELYEPLPTSYSGLVTLRVMGALYGDCRIEGGVIDLSNVGGVSSPALFALGGFRAVDVEDVVFRGPMASTTTVGLVAIAGSKYARITACRAEDVVCYAQAFAIGGAKEARATNLTIDGDLFGVYLGANDWELADDIVYIGRYAGSAHNYSIRAVKTEGSRHATLTNIIASDCETVVEWFNSGRGRIANIQGINIGLRNYVGQTAINIASTTGNGQLNTISVGGLVLENLGGVAIQVSGDSSGRISISDFHIKGCKAHAIIAEAVYFTAGQGVIENWNTGEYASTPAVLSTVTAPSAAITLHDIQFLNSVNPAAACLGLRNGPQYRLSNLTPADGNPMFDTTGGSEDVSDSNASALRSWLELSGAATAAFAAPSAWTPVDGSAAGLSLGSTSGRFWRDGATVVACGSVAYPVTASTDPAEIGGLPILASNEDPSGMFGVIVGVTDAGFAFTGFVYPNSTEIGWYKSDGSQVTNANFSGKLIRFTAIYRAGA